MAIFRTSLQSRVYNIFVTQMLVCWCGQGDIMSYGFIVTPMTGGTGEMTRPFFCLAKSGETDIIVTDDIVTTEDINIDTVDDTSIAT